jgi:hypothetical protein
MLQGVLKRGRIKNEQEYEHIIDSLVVAQQTGRITENQANALSEMIGEYKTRQSAKLLSQPKRSL